jgi:Flp pilus assembly protein TadG
MKAALNVAPDSSCRAMVKPRRWARPARGVAAVEMGILLLPLVTLAFGASEIGRAIYTYNTLDKTVRDAARYMSQHGSGDPVIQAEAKCLAVFGNTDCFGAAVATGLSVGQVTVCDPVACPLTHQGVATGSGSVNLVQVSITNYSFTSAVTFVFPSLNFNGISATLRAQL